YSLGLLACLPGGAAVILDQTFTHRDLRVVTAIMWGMVFGLVTGWIVLWLAYFPLILLGVPVVLVACPLISVIPVAGPDRGRRTRPGRPRSRGRGPRRR